MDRKLEADVRRDSLTAMRKTVKWREFTEGYKWYVVPNYQDKGRTASVVNSKGEQVAEFESIDEAEYVVSLVNSQSPVT